MEKVLILELKTAYIWIYQRTLQKKSNLLPVMFWIHGGGNTSGLKDLYDFNKMVKSMM